MASRGFPLMRLSGRGFVRSWSAADLVGNVEAAAGLTWASLRAFATFVRARPRVVVGVGGYASLPPGVAAVALRIPLVLAERRCRAGSRQPRARPDGRRVRGRQPGHTPAACRGDRGSRPRAGARGAPDAGEPPRCTEDARNSRGANDRVLHGGSLGARRINRVAMYLSHRWSKRNDLAIYHVTGRRDYEELAARIGPASHGGEEHGTKRERHGNGASGLWRRMVPYQDDFELLYQVADVMVCRAGAMTVAELAVTGVPSVLIPLGGAPSDHQTAERRAVPSVPAPQCSCPMPMRAGAARAYARRASRRPCSSRGDGDGGPRSRPKTWPSVCSGAWWPRSSARWPTVASTISPPRGVSVRSASMKAARPRAQKRSLQARLTRCWASESPSASRRPPCTTGCPTSRRPVATCRSPPMTVRRSRRKNG